MALPSGELNSSAARQLLEADLSKRLFDLSESDVTVGLALINANPEHLPSRRYVGLKVEAAKRLKIYVDLSELGAVDQVRPKINDFNLDPSIHGIVLQHPLPEKDRDETNGCVDSIRRSKDVDSLRTDGKSPFDGGTPKAILSLLESHGLDLEKRRIGVMGLGKLVGAPLVKQLVDKGAENVQAIDVTTDELTRLDAINSAEILISATGQPGILTPDLFDDLSLRRVLVDAGTAEQGGVVHGDVSDELRYAATKYGWGITPLRGGVGPLTVLSLLDNTVLAAERTI